MFDTGDLFDVNMVQLVVDVGNTRTKFAVLEQMWADDETLGKLPKCYGSFAYEEEEPIEWAAIREVIEDGSKHFVRSLISGSHPKRMNELAENWLVHFAEPRVIQEAAELPVRLDVEFPDKVGLDRIMNAMAANRLRPPGHWAIIVDTGTATTIDAVFPDGSFQGGAILPGYELAAQSLHHYTQLLPLISMEEINGNAPDVIGKNTNQAVRSGLIWGQVGAVNEIVSRLETSLTDATQSAGDFILTGGAAELLEPHLRHPFQLFPQLTLQGLGSLP